MPYFMLPGQIELQKFYLTKHDRLHKKGISVSGNQRKWKKDNNIIKLDLLGYEGLAETLISHFLSFTNIEVNDYVKYEQCLIYEDEKYLGLGCYSKNFVMDSEEITVRDLLEGDLLPLSISYDDLRDYLYMRIGFDTKEYIDKILCLDAITRNDDRHFGNISFLYKNGKYQPAPIFDNGSACMSDIITYPLEESFDKNFSSIIAEPFRTDFKAQLSRCNLIQVKYNEFVNNTKVITEEAKRAFKTILRGLEETEGFAWEEC